VIDRELLAGQFEEQRPHLVRVAYRMLGSMSEAEDAVQQTWLRLDRAGGDTVDNLGGWLTTVVARVCLDALRTRKAGREDFDGTWLPEPVVAIVEGPEEQALLADAVGLALLVVLDTLTPAERLAIVLQDMFSVSVDEIGEILERTPTAARQLASRARRRVRGAAPLPDTDLARQRRLVDAFLAASREGDFEGLVAVLHPDVVLRVDRGAAFAQLPIEGAERVAGAVLERGRPFAPHARPAVVNGAAGAVVGRDGRLFSVVAFTVSDGRIAAIDVVADPAKLSAVAASYTE
jgi:RNA polymerase sigma-70 factor (ECF subfamily)